MKRSSLVRVGAAVLPLGLAAWAGVAFFGAHPAVPIAASGDARRVVSLAPSPDGRFLAYAVTGRATGAAAATPDAGSPVRSTEIRVAPVSGSRMGKAVVAASAVGRRQVLLYDVRWNPTESRFLWYRTVSDPRGLRGELHEYDASKGRSAVLFSHPMGGGVLRAFFYSPRGDEVFVSVGSRLMRIRAGEKSAEVGRRAGDGENLQPVAVRSVDGKPHLVELSWGASDTGRNALWSVGIAREGRDQTRSRLADRIAGAVAQRPGDDHLWFYRAAPGDASAAVTLASVSLRTGRLSEVGRLPPGQVDPAQPPAVSPHGTRFLVSGGTPGSACSPGERPILVLSPGSTAAPAPVMGEGGKPACGRLSAWGHSDRLVWFVRGNDDIMSASL